MSPSSFNLYCLNFSNDTCTHCMQGYYLKNGGCTFANPLCATYNMNDGGCTSCYAGYFLEDETCTNLFTINPYCLTSNG